jgi:hypothetical protein
MKRKLWLLIPAAALAGLLACSSDPGVHSRGPVLDEVSSGQPGLRPEEPVVWTGAQAPTAQQMPYVQPLARELAASMKVLQDRLAERLETGTAGRMDPGLEGKLQALGTAARAFSDETAASAQEPAAVLPRYEQLVGAYLRVAEALKEINAPAWHQDQAAWIYDELREIERKMTDLSGYFGGFPPVGSPEYNDLVQKSPPAGPQSAAQRLPSGPETGGSPSR